MTSFEYLLNTTFFIAFNLRMGRSSDSSMHNPLINDRLLIPQAAIPAVCERRKQRRRSEIAPFKQSIVF